MSDLSFMLARAVDRGRAGRGVPKNRAEVLVALLRKRAEAHRRGLDIQEEKLREQIRWSLPMHEAEDAEAA
jgi:hypothetical protein